MRTTIPWWLSRVLRDYSTQCGGISLCSANGREASVLASEPYQVPIHCLLTSYRVRESTHVITYTAQDHHLALHFLWHTACNSSSIPTLALRPETCGPPATPSLHVINTRRVTELHRSCSYCASGRKSLPALPRRILVRMSLTCGSAEPASAAQDYKPLLPKDLERVSSHNPARPLS